MRLLLLAAVSAALYAASLGAARLHSTRPHAAAQAAGAFRPGGEFRGEPLAHAAGIRTWGSWSGSDENTGALALGPFPAPADLRVAVGGYPARPGNELYVEHAATGERRRIESPDVGERWRLVDAALPADWHGQPITLHAIDGAKASGGWLAVSEPIRGGRSAPLALLCATLAVLVPGTLLLWRKSPRRAPPPHAGAAAHAHPRARLERALPWLLGAVALLPFVACRRAFRDLWWFGDEWDQLDQIARLGFWHWTVRPFGENVVPLFKAAWGGLALASGGSYFPMIVAVWLTHALNTALLARLLRSVGFGWAGTSLAAVVFALTVANSEILGWSIQWSNALAVLFLLLGLAWLLRPAAGPEERAGRSDLVLAFHSAASALTFVRGVLTGIVLACGAGFAPARGAARVRTALACLVPTAAVVVWIFLGAPGNHHDLGRDGLWLKAVEFAAWFWAAVPLHRLLEFDHWDAQSTLVLGALKLVLVAGALRHTPGAARRLLALLLLFDLGNAALLGLGRYQTGLQFANSSRYYYNALVCTLPFVAFACDRAIGALRGRALRAAVAGVAIVGGAAAVGRTWARDAEVFATWRGRNTRQILLRDPQPPVEGAVPGIPFLRTERAKELIGLYHLH